MATAAVEKEQVFGYMPSDTPPVGSMISLGFQQVLTMFPATVLVAILTKFDVGDPISQWHRDDYRPAGSEA